MDHIKQDVDQYLAGEDSDLSSAMFSAYRPAIESYYSGLNLNYTSPEEDHPILGGRPMEGDLQGIICLLYTSPSPRDLSTSRMPSSA